MAWIYLLGAIAFGLFPTTALKLSDGVTKLSWNLGMAVGNGCSAALDAERWLTHHKENASASTLSKSLTKLSTSWSTRAQTRCR